jgi:hypothetical protein
MTKIIIYTLYIHRIVFVIFIREILTCESGYVVISFKSYNIFFYIKNMCRFHCFTYLHYKMISHGGKTKSVCQKGHVERMNT